MAGLVLRLGAGLVVAGGGALLATKLADMLQQARQRVQLGRTPCGNPLPREVHAVLPAAETANKRIIIVGDIHGCADELQALLQKLGYRRGEDLLLSVGDLVNKGPDSEKVLKVALEEGMRPMRGNHDDSAYAAFRAWLDGKDIPKPKKQGWVAGLPEELAALLADLPYTLSLPAYGVLIVHAGLVPGVPLERQALFDLEKMRDLIPAAEEEAADAAAAGLAAGNSVDSLPTGSFNWEACGVAMAQLARCAPAPPPPAAAATAAEGAPGSSGSGTTSGSGEAPSSGAPASLLPPDLVLLGREQPNPVGRAWAGVWNGQLPGQAGPLHIVFGHDAKRRLQLHRAATGLDTGCVYGGELTALVLPPLSEQGVPLLDEAGLPPDAQEIGLCSGLPAFLVQVPATGVHSNKYEQPAQQLKAAREEAAKRHTQAALAAQQAQQRAGGSVQLVQQARAAVQEAAAAAAAAPKSAADKKDE